MTSLKDSRGPRKCIFLDRDGTINRFAGRITRPEDLVLAESAAEAIRAINASEYLAIVVTNQTVVARGDVTLSELDAIHERLRLLLEREGAYVDDLFFCPHHPERGFAGERPEYKIVCDCRKPATGMIRQAKEKHDIDLSASWIIGDTCVDVLTGIRAGLHTVLLETGDPDKERLCQAKPEWRAKTLLDAVRLILPAPEKKTPT